MLKISKHTLLLYIIIPFVGFIIDYTSKLMVISQLCIKQQNINIIPFFQLVCVVNTGVSFGFLANIVYGKIILIITTVIILCIVYIMMHKERDIVSRYCYSVIIAGAFGNIIDRIIHGGVIDFLDFYYKTHHYPAFNVADSLICIGVFAMVVRHFSTNKRNV